MRFRNPNTSRIAKNKIAALFDRIVRRNAQRARGSIFDILSELFIEFKMFFTKAKSPKFQFTPLREGDVVVAEKYNDTVMDAAEDISVCTDEVNAIKPIVVGGYNSARQMAKELENRSEAALSKITDIRLFEGQLGQEIIVVGDDFLTTNRVDARFSLNAPSADVRTAEGLVTLNRVESLNLVGDDTNISCEPTMPGDILTDQNTGSTNIDRYYEGNFYNFIGNARPEGGNWHLEERSLIADLDAESTATAENDVPDFFQNDLDTYIPGTALRPQDIVVYDRGASEEEKNTIRRKMFDEDSSTFWEAEYVKDFAPVDEGNEEEGVQLTSQELANIAVSQDTKDFEVQITVDLGSEKPVTWLSLDPINFGETAWLEITDIATQSSAEEGFKTIPNLFNNRFANTLTNEANEELQADVAAQILAPDRNSFKGKGVFNFPTVFAQYIRIKVKQKVPVPNLYQRLSIQLTRAIDESVTVTEQDSGGGLGSAIGTAIGAAAGGWVGAGVGNIVGGLFDSGGGSETTTTITQTRMSRLVKLTYLQTVKSYFNTSGINEYAGETAGSNIATANSTGGPSSNFLEFIGDMLFGYSTTTTNVNSTDTGWRVAKSWLEVNYNKMRYAIGIRELSIFSYKFSPTSEFVSKKFTSPKEIIKAQLEVIEEIPADFDPSQRYIEYYLSVDDENWHRINPTGNPTLYMDDGQIAPEVLNINFDVAGSGPNQTVRSISTESPATSVRLKVVMKTDTSLPNSEMYTPVLKKYRVKLFPRTSLSRT